jgi:transcriptional regulator with XRE-family HTH domain
MPNRRTPARRTRTSRRHRREPDPLAQAVGERIRRLRDQQEFSFDAFVEEVGLGRGYVSEIERGLVNPTLAALNKLAKALKVTVADLVLGDTPRERLFEVAARLDAAAVRILLEDARRRASAGS